jgi:DNA-binding NtrC family response regulator
VSSAKRVLVADDDATILHLLTTILLRYDYEVETAANGREALTKMAENSYDVVLLDLMMPEVSGFDVLENLHLATTSPRNVVIISAVPAHVLAAAANEHVFATLQKPFLFTDVITTINACVAARQ